jgi:hypothetical protein
MNETRARRPREVWLLAGQSNMIGYGPVGSELSPAWRQSPPNVRIHMGQGWAPVAPGDGGFGPEVGFAHAMSSARPETDFLLIKPLFGLGSLWEDWRSPGTGRGPEGPHYRALLDLVTLALAQEPGANIAGMLWMQGEADAHFDLGRAENYERNLTLFIASVRNALAAADMAFVIGQIAATPVWVFNAIVRQAQAKVAASTPRTAVFDTDDLPLCDDRMHYTPAGSLELGRRFAVVAAAIK